MNPIFENLKFTVYTPDLKKSTTKDGRRLIRGYASTSSLDRQNEVITIEALRQAADHLLENHTVFYEHEHQKYPVGRCIDTEVDDKGLKIAVEISKTADQLWTLIEEGILDSFSIGGRVTASEEKVGKDNKPYNEITGIELLEVSVVGLPAQSEARFQLVNKSFSMAIADEIKRRKEDSVAKKEIKKVEKVKAESTKKVEDTLADSQKKDLEKYEVEDKAKASEKTKEEKKTTKKSQEAKPEEAVESKIEKEVVAEEKKVVVEGEKVEEQKEIVEDTKEAKVTEEKVAETKSESTKVDDIEKSTTTGNSDTIILTDGTSDTITIIEEEKAEEVVAEVKEEKPAESSKEKSEIKPDNLIVTDEEFEKLAIEDISKPYPNEHAARIRPVGDFQEGSFRSKQIAEGIRIIIGRLIGETTATVQSYRFHVDHFTAEEAKQWLKDHNITYILFEPAKKSEELEEKPEEKIEEKPVEEKKEDKTAGTQVRILTEEKVLELLKQLEDKIDTIGEKINAIEEKALKIEEVKPEVEEKPKAEKTKKKEEPKVEKKEEKIEEKPQRKSFIADAPYANDRKDEEKKEKDTKKTTDKGWTQIVYGR